MIRTLLILVMLALSFGVTEARAENNCPSPYLHKNACAKAVSFAENWHTDNCYIAGCPRLGTWDGVLHWNCTRRGVTNPRVAARCHLWTYHSGGYVIAQSYFNIRTLFAGTFGVMYDNCHQSWVRPYKAERPVGKMYFRHPTNPKLFVCYSIERYIS